MQVPLRLWRVLVQHQPLAVPAGNGASLVSRCQYVAEKVSRGPHVAADPLGGSVGQSQPRLQKGHTPGAD